MKHLGLGHILLLIGVGLLLGQATAELTAYQSLVPSADVGQMVTVTVSLTYNGQTPTQAVVTPSLPYGVVANAGEQSTDLYPGVMKQIRYPLTAQQSGSYWIVSEISYAEDGTTRYLRLEAPFTATDAAMTEPRPMPQEPTPGAGPDGSNPMGTDPFANPQEGSLPSEVSPGDKQPDNNGKDESGFPEDAPDQGERPPGEETNPA
ncbi:MAG: hypothetical protein QG575_1357 [Euryarchaeota archaeon]|nr:hypothetical protein [Euryarchaeota archaeon]